MLVLNVKGPTSPFWCLKRRDTVSGILGWSSLVNLWRTETTRNFHTVFSGPIETRQQAKAVIDTHMADSAAPPKRQEADSSEQAPAAEQDGPQLDLNDLFSLRRPRDARAGALRSDRLILAN